MLFRSTLADTGVILALTAGISIPNFAMAAYLVYLFSIKLQVLPVAGWGSFAQAVLPVGILAIAPAAYIARLTRSAMLESSSPKNEVFISIRSAHPLRSTGANRFGHCI